jgi:hypothetical protein
MLQKIQQAAILVVIIVPLTTAMTIALCIMHIMHLFGHGEQPIA